MDKRREKARYAIPVYEAVALKAYEINAQEATRQVCVVRDFADDPIVAWRAFERWGTYSQSLIRADNG